MFTSNLHPQIQFLTSIIMLYLQEMQGKLYDSEADVTKEMQTLEDDFCKYTETDNYQVCQSSLFGAKGGTFYPVKTCMI